jgi:hypothetical protein
MSYPFTIPSTPAGAGFDYGNNGNAIPGQFAFEYAGNQYLVGYQDELFFDPSSPPSADEKIHCIKSTDIWQSAGIELDAGGAPSLPAVAAFGTSYTVALDGSLLIVIGVEATFGPNELTGINVWTMDLSAGTPTWTTVTPVAVPTLDYLGYDSTSSRLSQQQVFIQLVVRGTGDYLFLYSGPQATSGITGFLLANIYCATFNGTTFGTPTILPNQAATNLYFMACGGVSDSTGVTHVIGIDEDDNLKYWKINHDLSFGATQSIQDASTIYYWDRVANFATVPIIFMNGMVETVATMAEMSTPDFATQSMRFFSAPVSTSVWSAGQIVTTGVDGWTADGFAGFSAIALFPVSQFFTSIPVVLVVRGTTLTAVWTITTKTSVLQGSFYTVSSTDAGATWSAPALLFNSLSLEPACPNNEAAQIVAYNCTAAGAIAVMGVTIDQINEDPDTGTSYGIQFFTTVTPMGTGPCEGIVAQPDTDVQFELRRAYATLTPHKRLPVRGS